MERVVLSPFFSFFFSYGLWVFLCISLVLFTLVHVTSVIYIITRHVIVHVAIQDRAHAPFFFPQTEPRRHLSLARAFSLSLSRSPVLSLSRSHSAENDLNRFNKQDVTGCRTLTITLYKPTLTLPN